METLPVLNVREEFLTIRNAFRESKSDVVLRNLPCNIDNFRKTLTKGTDILHFTGHGAYDFVPFENGKGKVHYVENAKLLELLLAGCSKNEQELKLAFVNSCNSHNTGLTFVNAGVPHVVCFGGDPDNNAVKLEDDCAVEFVTHFYLALALGKSIKDSFDIGKASVLAMEEIYSCVNYSAQADLFELLPQDAPHDEAIFDDSHSTEAKGTITDISSYDSTKENLPSSPCHFEGRQFDLYCLVQKIIHSRVVAVSGSFGMGKSTLAICAARYLFERNFFECVVYVKVSSVVTLSEDIMEKLKSYFQENYIPFSSPDDFVDLEFLHQLRFVKILLVLDGSESLIDGGALHQFRSLLKLLIRHTAELKVVLTTSKEAVGRLHTTTETVMEITPLNNNEVAKMILRRAPALKRNYTSREEFIASVANHQAVKKYLNGNPFRVGLVASLIQRMPRDKRNLDEVLLLLKLNEARSDDSSDNGNSNDDEDEEGDDDSQLVDGIDDEIRHLVKDICNVNLNINEEPHDIASRRSSFTSVDGPRRRAPQRGKEWSSEDEDSKLRKVPPPGAEPKRKGEHMWKFLLDTPVLCSLVLFMWFLIVALDGLKLQDVLQRLTFLAHFLLDIFLVASLYYLRHHGGLRSSE